MSLPGPTRLGVVANVRSWRNRGTGAGAVPDGALFEAPETLDGYPGALRRLAEAGCGVVAVDGGDGTLRDVLSALPEAYGDDLPAIALVPSGKTNVAALDVGGLARGAEALAELSEAARRGAGLQLLGVRRPIVVAADGWTRLGFVFGLGAFERTTRLVNKRVHSRGFAQEVGVALGVLLGVASAFVGRNRRIWLDGVPLAMSVDGSPMREGASFALLATSLEKLVLGLYPFYGEGRGAIRATEISANPPHLLRALYDIARRKEPSVAGAEAHYHGVRADRISLRLSERFIFDGDTFSAGPDGRVELAAGPTIRFVAT